MIVTSLLNVIYRILSAILSPFHVPGFDPDSLDNVSYVIDLIFESCESFIGLFLPWGLIITALKIVLIVIGLVEGYKLVMWILRKIPMLGIQ